MNVTAVKQLAQVTKNGNVTFCFFVPDAVTLLATGSIADTCVSRGNFFLFSFHPNFAVRY